MVRTIRKSCIIVCFLSFFAWAGNDEELFLRANKLYEAHDYDKALSSYEMIPHKGRAVLYNMGNCYFYKNDYPRALAYWSKAEKGATVQEKLAIDRNKHYVLEKLGKKNDYFFAQRMYELFEYSAFYVSFFCLQLLLLLVWYCLFF